MDKQKEKSKKRKSTSVLSFFVLWTNKNEKTKINFRFIVLRFIHKLKEKKRKTKLNFRFIVLRFMQVHLRCHGVGVGGSRGRLRPIYIWVGEVVRIAKLAGCCKL